MARQQFWYALLVLVVLILALAGYGGYVLYPRFGLPAVHGASLLFLAVAAGIGSFFSPCSFPLVVTLLARPSGLETQVNSAESSLNRALVFASALALGTSAFLLLTGSILALGGEALFAEVTFTSPQGRVIRFVVGLGLTFLGLIQSGKLPFSLDVVARLANPLMQAQARQRRQRPVVGFVILGFAYPLTGFG